MHKLTKKIPRHLLLVFGEKLTSLVFKIAFNHSLKIGFVVKALVVIETFEISVGKFQYTHILVFWNGLRFNYFNVSSTYNRENNHGLAVKSLKNPTKF